MLLNEFADVIHGVEAVMIRCLDIHTHHPAPQPEAVVSLTSGFFETLEGQLYSIGIHPWNSDHNPTPEQWETFEDMARSPQVTAIGECGIDSLRGGPMFQQILIMKKQIEISENLEKPLIIHDVKAHDIIIGLKRDLKPRQNWVIHGFRGKPSVARMLLNAGLWLSFGEKFNPETIQCVPSERILAETDESVLPIVEIIARISEARGKDLTEIILENTSAFLGLNS